MAAGNGIWHQRRGAISSASLGGAHHRRPGGMAWRRVAAVKLSLVAAASAAEGKPKASVSAGWRRSFGA